MTTTLVARISILSELWLNYRNDEEFADFVAYNDIGLPIAYALDNGIVGSTELAETFISETFDLLIGALAIEDTGFDSLDELFDSSLEK